jgi:hypothetical protein
MPRKSKSPKPCPPGKERNQATGRCRKANPCPPGKERNQATGRCRNIKSPKPCPPGKERNQATGRCRNVKSPKSKSKKVESPKSSPKIQNEKGRSPSKSKKSPSPKKSPPKLKSPSPKKSPPKQSMEQYLEALKKHNEVLKKQNWERTKREYKKYNYVAMDSGTNMLYFPKDSNDSGCFLYEIDSTGTFRKKYTKKMLALMKRSRDLGFNKLPPWLQVDEFKNLKTFSMVIPPGKMVKIWTLDDDPPRIFKAGIYYKQSIVGSTGNGPQMFWAGIESRSDDIPDSLRMISNFKF